MSILRNLRTRSIDELVTRGRQALFKRAEWLAFSAGIPARGLTRPGQRIAIDRIALRPAVDSLASDIHASRRVAELLAAQEPSTVAAIRKVAAEIRQGRVALLGLGAVSLGDPPDWHRDPMTGTTAPRKHWSRIPYLDTGVVGDHKVLWEFNRHQYLIASAQSWLLDGELRDFELVERHICSWIRQNPPRAGVNWASSLEISYRAISWCWLLWLLADGPWDETVRRMIVDSLEVHGLHIERYLSTYFSPNTHLTGEALGLFYIGTVVPESEHAQRWRTCGAEILEECASWHVLPDGVYFEQASHYHRYTVEIYLHFARLSESTGRPASKDVKSALSRMLDVLRTVVDGIGLLPAVGDDDGGALLALAGEEPAQLRGLLLAGAAYLNRPDWIIPGDAHRSLSYFLCGPAATDKVLANRGAVPPWTDVHFAEGGIAVIRDEWAPDAAVAVIDCGPHGAMNCGHAHADALSLVVHQGATPVLVDRGTLTYVGADRNSYRATASHNTLEIDGLSSVAPAGPFQWRGIPRRAQGALLRGDQFVVFDGLAYGHADTSAPSVHRRVVIHVRGGAWVIYDKALRQPKSRATTHWHFAAGSIAIAKSACLIDVQNQGKQTIASCCFPISPAVNLLSSAVSTRFGASMPAAALRVDADSELASAAVLITSNIGGRQTLSGDSAAQEYRGCTWVDTTGRYLLAFPAIGHGEIDLFGLHTTGSAFLFRGSEQEVSEGGFAPDSVVIVRPSVLADVGQNDPAVESKHPTLMVRRAPDEWLPRTMYEVMNKRG